MHNKLITVSRLHQQQADVTHLGCNLLQANCQPLEDSVDRKRQQKPHDVGVGICARL